jgi:hypothetical protein
MMLVSKYECAAIESLFVVSLQFGSSAYKVYSEFYSYTKRGHLSPELGIMKYETVACSF